MGAVSSVIDVNNSAGFKGFFDKFPSLFLQATESLARSCCIAGRLDAKRLDQQQVASYELAFVYAEYRAASVAWETQMGEVPCAPGDAFCYGSAHQVSQPRLCPEGLFCPLVEPIHHDPRVLRHLVHLDFPFVDRSLSVSQVGQ